MQKEKKKTDCTFHHPNAQNLGQNNGSQGQSNKVKWIKCDKEIIADLLFLEDIFCQQFSKLRTIDKITIFTTKYNK